MSGQRLGIVDQPGQFLVHLFGDTGFEYADQQFEGSGDAGRRLLPPLTDLDQIPQWFNYAA